MNYIGVALRIFNGYIVWFVMETLSERLEKQIANTKRVIEFLETRDEVLWVKHPYAKGNKYKALADKYMPKGGRGDSFIWAEGKRTGTKEIS